MGEKPAINKVREGILEMSNRLPEHMMKMINVQRHDWLNHIQVLSGLIKLENYEEVNHYLENIVSLLQNEQLISQLGNTDLILYILSYTSRYPSLVFEVEMAEKINLNDYNISADELSLLMQILELFALHTIYSNDLLPSLLLTMGKLESKVQFTLDFVGRLDEQMAPKWNRISKELIELGTTIHSKEKGENEWLLEIIMG